METLIGAVPLAHSLSTQSPAPTWSEWQKLRAFYSSLTPDRHLIDEWTLPLGPNVPGVQLLPPHS